MKRTLTKLATVTALAAGLALAQAPPPASGQGLRRPLMQQMRQRMMGNLNLTDSQKAQAKTIFQQARDAAQPVQKQIQQDRQALTSAIRNNDPIRIQQLSTSLGNLRGQVLAIQSAAQAQFYALLTPDQRAKAEQLRQRAARRPMRQRAGRNNG